MASSTKIGEVLGIPIRVHITLWIFLPLIATYLSSSLFWGLIGAVGLFVSVALHQLGHSFVAQKKGCIVREILLIPFGGIAKVQGLPSNPKDEIHIAIAGPAVSLILAFGLFGLGYFIMSIGLISLGSVTAGLGIINLGLALFNLLPSFPMDGGRVFRAWLTPKVGRLEATRRAAKTGRIMAVIFGVLAFHPQFPLSLLAIAIFIYIAAGSEYRAIQVQESFKNRPFGAWGAQAPPPANRNITVGPAPYEDSKTPPPRKAEVDSENNFFEEIYRRWR